MVTHSVMSDSQESISVEPPASRDLGARAMRAAVAAALFQSEDQALEVDRYEIIEQLGQGGMGQVHAAWDSTLGRKVALKVLPAELVSDPRERARLVREAQALAKLSHPNVVHVYEVGEVEHGVFVAMELVEGSSLRAWQAARPRSRSEILEVYGQAGRGLAAAHRAGLVHRDVKPSNVLVGDDGRVRVVDFGLAQGPGLHSGTVSATGRRLSASSPASVTRTGAQAGTPPYMAPEQFMDRPADARSDQFSFCVALYEALVGCRPFERAALHRVAERPLPPPTRGEHRLPLWVGRVVRRGLAADPARRWPDMDALLHALASGDRWRRRVWTWSGPILLAAGAAALALSSSGVDACVRPSDSPPEQWSEARSAQVRGALLATELPFAAPTHALVDARLTAYAEDWGDAHARVCHAAEVTHYPDITECLDDHTLGFSVVLDAFEAGDPEAVIHARSLLDTLGRPLDCLRVPSARAEAASPPSPEVARALKVARVELAKGRAVEGLEQLEAIANDPGLGSARAEWLVLGGRALAKLGQLARAQSRLTEAVEHDVGEGRVQAQLARLEVLVERERWQSAHDVVEQIGVALARLDPSPRLQAEWLELRGRMALEELPLRLDEGQALLLEAIDLRQENALPGVVASERTLAGSYADQGDEGQAEQIYQRLLQEIEAEVGPEHPDYAAVLFDMGLMALYGEDYERARELFARVLEIDRVAYGDASTLVGRTHVVLAQALLLTGETERALVHARQGWAVQTAAALPVEHSDRRAALEMLASCEQDAGHYPEALRYNQQLHDEYEDMVERPDVLQNIAWLHCQVGRCDEAAPWVERARAAVEAQREALADVEDPQQRQAQELELELLALYLEHVQVRILEAAGQRAEARTRLEQLRARATALELTPEQRFAQVHVDKLLEETSGLLEQLSAAR